MAKLSTKQVGLDPAYAGAVAGTPAVGDDMTTVTGKLLFNSENLFVQATQPTSNPTPSLWLQTGQFTDPTIVVPWIYS